MKRKSFAAILSVGILSGCVTQTDLISQGNYEKLGYYDGQNGSTSLTEPQFNHLIDSAKGKPVATAFADYQTGYEQGRDQYCTTEHLFALGEQGKVNWGICEYRREQDGLYLLNWQRGFERFGKEPNL